MLGIMVLEDELGLGNQNDEIGAIRKTVMDWSRQRLQARLRWCSENEKNVVQNVCTG